MACRNHLLNNIIWPDFTVIPPAVIKLRVIEEGDLNKWVILR